MLKHGQQILDFQDELNQGYSLLHYAVKIQD